MRKAALLFLAALAACVTTKPTPDVDRAKLSPHRLTLPPTYLIRGPNGKIRMESFTSKELLERGEQRCHGS